MIFMIFMIPPKIFQISFQFDSQNFEASNPRIVDSVVPPFEILAFDAPRDTWKHTKLVVFFRPFQAPWNTVDGWNPANQLRLVVYTIIYKVLAPSQVV